eukprot:scaffold1062_cov74-Skeletonema_menzelii.AAC.4
MSSSAQTHNLTSQVGTTSIANIATISGSSNTNATVAALVSQLLPLLAGQGSAAGAQSLTGNNSGPSGGPGALPALPTPGGTGSAPEGGVGGGVHGNPSSTATSSGAGTLPAQMSAVDIRLEELKAGLSTCGLTNDAARDRFISSQGLLTLDCLASLTQKDVKGLVETFNTTCVGTLKDQAIGYMPIKRIGALAYAVDKCNRRNERFDITTWNATAIQEVVRSEMSDLVEGDRATAWWIRRRRLDLCLSSRLAHKNKGAGWASSRQ